VVSLGGGAVLDESTRASLAGLPVVMLSVSASAVESRLAGGSRPLLTRGGIDAWREIAAERDPIYRDVASVVVDTSHRPVSSVVDDIVAWLDPERGTP
jgi:shikimate kinase